MEFAVPLFDGRKSDLGWKVDGSLKMAGAGLSGLLLKNVFSVCSGRLVQKGEDVGLRVVIECEAPSSASLSVSSARSSRSDVVTTSGNIVSG